MITHRMIPARELRPGPATIVISLPGRTIRSRAVMVQAHAHGVVQVAFASGDILSFSAGSMVGWIDHARPRSRRAS